LGETIRAMAGRRINKNTQAIEFAPWKPLVFHMTTPIGGLDECWMIFFNTQTFANTNHSVLACHFEAQVFLHPGSWRRQVFHCFTASFWKRFVDFTGLFSLKERHLGTRQALGKSRWNLGV